LERLCIAVLFVIAMDLSPELKTCGGVECLPPLLDYDRAGDAGHQDVY
jgi:hypothetical protein